MELNTKRTYRKPLFGAMVITVLLLISCAAYTGTASNGQSPQSDSAKLKQQVSFPIGAAVNINHLKNRPAYRALVISEFNSLTPENCMKPSALQPDPGVFNWTDADYLVDFALANNIRVHGHTLVWHQSLPQWIKDYRGSKTDWDTLLKTHIQTIVKHFKGKVGSWDVVNEAFNDDGTYRASVWYNNLGKDYIAKSFIYAHEADAGAKLFYNDYGHEYSPAKRKAIINMLAGLKQAGVPVDGIGMQMHTHIGQIAGNINAAINAAAQTGLLVHIAELDVAVNRKNSGSITYSAVTMKKQADIYTTVFKTYLGIPQSQQFGITFWNVSDADSWIPATYKRADWPLLFDKTYQRKSVYRDVLDAVKQRN